MDASPVRLQDSKGLRFRGLGLRGWACTCGSVYDVQVAVRGGHNSLQARGSCQGPGQQHGSHDPAPSAEREARQVVPCTAVHEVHRARVGGKGHLQTPVCVHVPEGGTLQATEVIVSQLRCWLKMFQGLGNA